MTKRSRHFIPFGFDEKQRVDEMIDRVKGTLGSKNSTDQATEVIALINVAMVRGEKWGGRVLRACAVEGMRRYIIGRDSRKTNPAPLPSGEIVELKEVYGTRAVDERGVQQSYWEREEWWTVPRKRFFRMLSTMRGQYTKLGLKLRALERAVPALDRHPDAATALEACKLDGLDPRDFGMRDAG